MDRSKQPSTNAIRDPVHGWIKFSEEEKGVIDSPFFQRLRRITQLSMADEVFPGGVHTRFIHSLGAMKVSGKYMKQLFRNMLEKQVDEDGRICTKISEDDMKYATKLARMGGLLHDIGHGGWSHAWDRSVYSEIYGADVNSHFPDGGHDIHRLAMVKHKWLSEPLLNCGVDPEDIIKVWEAEENDGLYFIIKTIIGGPLGADRIDFIMRDSYFTGTQHLGTIAMDRIISNCSLYIGETKGETLWKTSNFYLCYKDKCVNDIIQALDGRRFMYQDVYFHKTVMASTILIEKMLANSIRDLNLIEETKNLEKFVYLNEHTLIGKIMSLPGEHESRKLCERLLMRNLPKMKFDTIYPASLLWEESEWKEIHPEYSHLTFVRTRPITGIDPTKFDYYHIRFLQRDGRYIKCSSMLKNIKFTPMKPYYIVRGFDMNEK